MITEYVRDNALMKGTARLGDRAVDLKSITAAGARRRCRAR